MICHKHRCIFIHIPRTAGSSIESSIRPEWNFDNYRDLKHIVASTAKSIYKDYWYDYYKFTFIRNPWDRMVSMTKYDWFYGCKIVGGKLDVSGYLEKFPGPEIDSRSKSRGEKIDTINNSVYLNIINEELDFIGRFENLQEDYNKVCSTINCSNTLLHIETNNNKTKHYTEYYDDVTREIVAERYARDIELFGYVFGE